MHPRNRRKTEQAAGRTATTAVARPAAPSPQPTLPRRGKKSVPGGGDGDAVGSVQREMDDVRGIMTRNIEGLLERGERIDLLVDKTDRLGGSAREFRVRSRGLKRQMWWRNVKLMALLGLVLVLILLTIVIAVKNS